MRIFSLIQLFTALIAFGVYFYFIEPVINDNKMLKYLMFGLVFFFIIYFPQKIKGRYEFLERRIDNQLSVWIVFGLIFIPIFIGLLN
ncbi:hypothetical protein [Paenisporosarcina sp.]|uniref:hypothetical protein n=1 Tax=Paenisporosarcina sp. TaxID=1932001 RepID=UPI003C71789B